MARVSAHARVSDVIEAIAEEIEGLAASLEDVERSAADDGVIFARSGVEFGLVDERGFEFNVGAAIGGAARRTPNVTAGRHGPDWVRFEPNGLDRYAVDRAVSWFEAAWRGAGPR